MKSIVNIFLVILVIGVSAPTIALADIDTGFKTDITNACIVSGKSKAPVMKDIEKVCECVAKKHFASALEEPDELDGSSGLSWILEYYRLGNSKKLSEFAQSNDVLVEYDLAVVQDCLELVRGK